MEDSENFDMNNYELENNENIIKQKNLLKH